mmetsp:Transcript_17252/g.44264  ORF Transcript_17252/g.44264 Transcript_17252/m.44264 type:complete len:222 (+) Transcript_17252:140-805(+)
MVEPRKFESLAVFCGSSIGADAAYEAAAVALGTELAKRGITLVYGGGNVGLMGVVSTAVVANSSEKKVIGVIPTALCSVEISGENKGTTHVVGDMHERKAKMAQLSEGFICLPGGFGTLEEALEMITWHQLGFHSKPVGLLNINGFYDKLLEFFDHCVSQGFVRQSSRDLVLSAEDPAELLDKMASYQGTRARPQQCTAVHSASMQNLIHRPTASAEVQMH